MVEKKRKCLTVGIYAAIFILLIAFLFSYLWLATGPIPLMDFWKGFSDWAVKAFANPFPEFKDLVPIPHDLHWNPFSTAAQYIFLFIFKCDNRAYIYTGGIFLSLSILFLLLQYHKKYETSSIILNAFGAIMCVLPLLNLNQWEILTLWCSFSFTFRILVFLRLMSFTDHLAHQYSFRRACILGTIGFPVILLMSQAYFPGFVMAIVSILWIDFIIEHRGAPRSDNQKKLYGYIVVTLSYAAGVLFYLITLDTGSQNIVGNVETSSMILQLIQKVTTYIYGILIMLGSIVIPTSEFIGSIPVVCFVGILILLLTITALILYFRRKIYQISYFPLACLIYAFVSIIVIISGRSQYGIEYLRSSRYVVETTILLLGNAHIYWLIFAQYFYNEKVRKHWGIIALTLLVVQSAPIFGANVMEFETAPFRKAYNDSMVQLALNIDTATDEELTIFQAPASDVREGIEVMKEYDLCVFSNR